MVRDGCIQTTMLFSTQLVERRCLGVSGVQFLYPLPYIVLSALIIIKLFVQQYAPPVQLYCCVPKSSFVVQ